MGSVILGKLALSWCTSCNLPVLGRKCGICLSSTEKVKHTPPGDIRPSFGKDQEPIRALIDEQFGGGCSDLLLPPGNIVIFNRIPDQDRMEEIIVSGIVVGNYRYNVGEGYTFLLKPEGALRILPRLTRSWVRVDNEAAVFIRKSTSVLVPGVMEADPAIEPGEEVVVITEDSELIGSGTAKLTGKEMVEMTRGLGVRLRRKWQGAVIPENYEKGGTWEQAVVASRFSMENHEREAMEFITRTIAEHPDVPMMVSLSGGKDSLAVLLLVLEAGHHPGLLFLDTGLEFPETIENVRRTAERYGLELIVADAGEAFWENVDQFGPPSKDRRWCCKVCKLGPTARTIMENYPNGVLSFIGQRSYESQQRAGKSRVWKNPWVPGQIGASPIQYWTALHIWLCIFSKKAEYNPLYELGFSRIGCWLCPASDQGDLISIQEVHPDGKRWEDHLVRYAEEHGYTRDWVRYGLWKWRDPPGFVKDIMANKGITFQSNTSSHEGSSGVDTEDHHHFRFMLGEVYPSCDDEITAEGMFTRPLDMERLPRLLRILGDASYDPELGICNLDDHITITKHGSISIKAQDRDRVKNEIGKLVDFIYRVQECVGCGICPGRCSAYAIFLNEDNKLDIKEDLCIQCQKCLGKCPVVDFREDSDFDI